MRVKILASTFMVILFCGNLAAQTADTDTIPPKSEITELQEQTARKFRSQGNQFFADELYHEAIAEYSKAIAENPYDRVAWYNRAVSRARIDDKAGAIHDLTRVLELENGFVGAYFLRGTYHYELEEFRDAKNDFRDIISIRPNNALVYRKRGTARFQMKDRNGALKDYNESIRLNPKDPISFHDRSITRAYLGDKKGAKEDKKKADELKKERSEK